LREYGGRVTQSHAVHAVTNDQMISLPSDNVEIVPQMSHTEIKGHSSRSLSNIVECLFTRLVVFGLGLGLTLSGLGLGFGLTMFWPL